MNQKMSMLLVCLSMLGFVACTKEESAGPKTGGSKTLPPAQDDHAGHDHDADHGHGEGAHGPTIDLGTATISGWTVKAARSEDEVKPGGETSIDLWLSGGSGKIASVRLWIGSENASGSMKAKAEVENDQPGHWHAHAEAPASLLAGSKLWVELELEGAKKAAGSFDLKLTEGKAASGDMHGPQTSISAERCGKHNIPASLCAFCDPSLVEKRGFCGAHNIAEAWCTICTPQLIAAFKKEGDWCAEHGLPESQCKICKGEAANPGSES